MPSASKLPDDLNTTQKHQGTYSGLHPAALAGTGGQLVLSDVLMTASRQYAVTSSSGGTAVVKQAIEKAVGGQAQPTTVTLFAVDRTDFESTAAPSGASNVVKRQGLIFTLPLNPSTDATCRLWDADASVRSLADDTASKADKLNLLGAIRPTGLVVLGVLILVAALLIARRGGPAAGSTRHHSRIRPGT